jgi:hypothetical protein
MDRATVVLSQGLDPWRPQTYAALSEEGVKGNAGWTSGRKELMELVNLNERMWCIYIHITAVILLPVLLPVAWPVAWPIATAYCVACCHCLDVACR